MATNIGSSFPGLPQIIDKQFWSRPEGKFSMVILGLLAAGAATGGVIYLPVVLTYLAGIFTSMFSIALHAAGLFALIYAFFIDDSLRNILGHGYRSIMRNIASLVINLDPISIVKDYIKMLKSRLGKMETAIGNLKKQVTSLQQLIAKQDSEIEQSMGRLSAAKKAGKNMQGMQAGQLAGMLQQSNANLKKTLTKMELVYRVLLKMYEAAQFSITTTEQKVDITIREATALTQASIATSQAMKIINGDPSRKQWFDEAMGNLAWQTAQAVGEIDNFMEMSKGFFETVDLDKAVADETAMKMLEQWEKNLDGGVLLGGGVKASVVNDAYNPNVVLDLDAPATPQVLNHGPSDVKDYFN